MSNPNQQHEYLSLPTRDYTPDDDVERNPVRPALPHRPRLWSFDRLGGGEYSGVPVRVLLHVLEVEASCERILQVG